MATITQDIRPYDQVFTRNLITDPRFTTLANWNTRWFGSGGAGTHSASNNASRISGRALFKNWTTGAAVGNTGFQAPLVPVQAGEEFVLSGHIFVQSSSTKGAIRAKLQWLNSGGSTISTSTGSSSSHTSGSVFYFVTVTGTAPAGAVNVLPIWDVDTGTAFVAGDTLGLFDPMLTRAYYPSQTYIDGALPDTITTEYRWDAVANASWSGAFTRNPATDPVDPLQILSYKVTRAVRSITHDIINVGPVEVTLAPAGLRKGTIEYLFANAALLARAENIHAQGVSTITLSGAPYFGTMKYVPADTVVTELDIDTGVFKLITGFQEVA